MTLLTSFLPVSRPDPIRPDHTLDEELQKSAEDAELTLYFLNLVVVSGESLANTEPGFGMVNRTDAYCEVTVGNVTDRTPTVDNHLDPVWNEKMSFFVPQKPQKMTLTVKDENMQMKDMVVGSADFDFGSLFEMGGSYQGDVELRWGGKSRGKVHISFQCRVLKPVETEIKLAYTKQELDCLGKQEQATVAALDESEELRKQVIGELDVKEQEVLAKAAELEEAVATHSQILSVKDQELLEKAQEIEAKVQEKEEAEVARREAELQKKEAETKLTAAEQEIIAKAALLEEKEKNNKEALTEKEKEILALGDQLEAKQKLHEGIQERLAQVEALKVEVENELTSKEKIIQEQAKQLEAKAKENLEALSAKDKELLEKAKALDDRDAAAKEAQKLQDEANTQLASLRQAILEKEKEFNEQLMELQKEKIDLNAKLKSAEDECRCSIM